MLADISIFPLPDNSANSVWGCLVITKQQLKSEDVGKHELCQRVFANLFIPEKSKLSPYLSEGDRSLLFADHIHVFHPEFGLVKCEGSLKFEKYISAPRETQRDVSKPLLPRFIPKSIRSFQVKPVQSEDPLEELVDKAFPKRQKMPDERLNLLEHVKLKFYKQLFNKSKVDEQDEQIKKTPFGNLLHSFVNNVTSKNSDWTDRAQQDFEALDKRNQKQIDKLLDLLKKNPEDALKYAIPLDSNRSSRGADNGRFDLSRRWGNFSLFDNLGLGGVGPGGGIDLGDHFDLLSNQYRQTARELMDRKEYEKAAFVYMKLLKEYGRAAHCLEEGKLYHEAATIYLKYVKNKAKAAECFELGNMYKKAIDLHDELKNFEKAGDLSSSIDNKDDALKYYSKAVDVHKNARRYKEAGHLLYNKIGDTQRAQTSYLEGWDENQSAYQCLVTYFENIHNVEERKNEMETIYANRVSKSNAQTFIKVLQRDFKEKNPLSDFIKEFGYEIVSRFASTNPSILDELRVFSPDDKQLGVDISRFRYKR